MPNPKHSPRRRDTIRVEAARRQRSAQRRKVAESAAAAKVDELVRAAIELRDRMLDPATPLPDVVVLLLERYEGEPVPLGLDRMFTRRGASPERLAAVTEALLAADDDPASVTALSFAALVASGREEPAVCRHYLDQVLSRRPDEDEQLTLVNWLAYCGRRADALELLEPLLAADPAADAAVEVYGAVLEAVGDQAANRALTAQCTCGSGRSFGDCCRPRDAAACERFLDRRGLYALRDGLMAWLPASPYADPVDEHVADWLEVLRDQLPDLSEGLASALADLAIEHALVVALVTGEPDDPGPMRAFAADPTVPPELARRALDWSQHVHYGLWLVQDPTPGPGLWMTDIVTGIARYVAVAPEQVEGLVPWAVLLGAIIPVDGVWRLTRSAVQLSPGEADAACEKVVLATEVMDRSLNGRRSSRLGDRLAAPMSFGHVEPYGVYATVGEALGAELVPFQSGIVASLIPRFISEVLAHRAAPPTLANSEGHPLSLITAKVRVRDGAELLRRLTDHPDFDTDDPQMCTWLGAQMPADQRRAMLAEARAQLRAQGVAEAELPVADDEPGRWIRGQLQLEGHQLRLEVNSRERFAALLELLRQLGAQPQVVDESRVDPQQDFAWGDGPSLLVGGRAAPEEGWEGHWLDEPVPALRGRTPRQAAAGSPEERAGLEALLRDFEYRGGLLALRGGSGPDVAYLREQLQAADS